VRSYPCPDLWSGQRDVRPAVCEVWNSEVVPEFFSNMADIFRQIDAEFGVDLPFPAWDEVSTKRD